MHVFQDLIQRSASLFSFADLGEGGQPSDESKTIVLSTASRHGSRSRKIPLKLLKVKKESQLVVGLWLLYTFGIQVKPL